MKPDGYDAVRQSTVTIETHNDATVPAEYSRESMPRRRTGPITKMAIASIVFAGVYAGFQRIGTTANADLVEYTRNLAGGFLALGMTDDQPGFIALSAMDQDEVDVNAVQTRNGLAGTHTVVEVETPRGTTRTRLRGPRVILVTEQGDVETYAVDWTVKEFNALRAAADCSHAAALRKNRCGAPFTDLQEALAKWPVHRVPDRVRAFLAPFESRRSRR